VIPHDPALDAALGRAVWEPTTVVTFLSPAGVPTGNVAVIMPAGTYVADSSAWPRVQATLNVPTALTPSTTASPVSPFGGQVLIDVGFRFPGGSARSFRLATLDVAETVIARPDGTISVRAVSHEARVDEDRFTVPIDSPGGKGTALITALVRRTLGANHPVVNRVPPAQDPTYPARSFTYDGPVWAIVEEIADTAGIEAWFDPAGALVLAPTPVKGTPVLRYSTGNGGSIVGYSSARGWAANRVAVVYEDEQNARVTGLWEDTVATSATRVSGPYGRHTVVYRVPVTKPARLPTQADANANAANRAKREAAGYRSVTLSTIPAPWVECGDTVTVALLGGLVETLIVGRHEFPIDGLDLATVVALDDTYTRDLGAGATRVGN
jgi:hypothetical protein